MRLSLLERLLFVWLIIVGWAFEGIHAEAVEYDLRGQASGWHLEGRDSGDWYYNQGLRYIPQFTLAQSLAENHFLDLEISLNGFISASSSDHADDSDVELYRLKIRFATAQTETRVGLQKINFGPAQLLRPLRWFDRLDPRDPLNLTDGVYGLRFKYDALNNASLWFWGLYGNDETKGFELLPTVEGKPEFGGRLQYPFLNGELAFAFHTRKVLAPPMDSGDFRENRLALDGRWDIEIGLWFESVLQRQRSDTLPFEWTEMMTLGMDYTLGIGNGLHVLGEHMAIVSSEGPFGWEDDRQVSAYSMNYPLGYLDNLSAMGFYSWDEKEYSQYLCWQRTWDNWILKLSLFHYPTWDDVELPYRGDILSSGYGGEVLVVFNH
ncbi:MAG: hypothetical protein AMJ92_09505 [candidate division Zixibacteria bacterium SM23_81]|nr:MAG: hypothetical protein AMJ92_09505 [candidate division Zixibacteria bacterium SM23_81]